MVKKQPRILFFIVDSTPTAEECEAAEKCGNNVVFRNASMVRPGSNPENCEGVAGSVPREYEGIPDAEKVLKAFDKKIKADRKQEIENRKEQEKLNVKKSEFAKEAAENIKAAKAAKVKANKAVAEARKQAADAQAVQWSPGK